MIEGNVSVFATDLLGDVKNRTDVFANVEAKGAHAREHSAERASTAAAHWNDVSPAPATIDNSRNS